MAKKLTAEECQQIIDTLQNKLEEADKIAKKGEYGSHSHALGYLQGSIGYVIFQLKGIYPIGHAKG